MPAANKIGVFGSCLMLAGFLLPGLLDPDGSSQVPHALGSILALLGMGLVLAVAWKGPRWWLGVFFALLIAIGLILIFVGHQH
jgi:hypothetical protein